MSFISSLPLTKIKISFAKILYKITVLVYGKKPKLITRDGIRYEVDLSEGIDLSLFLFGNFQRHVTKSKYINIPENGVVLDIGANFGIMSLQFAKAVPMGKVYAFEPTHYALAKLRKNISLNPSLAPRITVINSFVSKISTKQADIKAFSSWKVSGEKKGDMHPVHWGEAKPTEGVGSITLNDFVVEYGLKKLDFIKIDTDGHEYEVFTGGKEAISKYRPQIIFEIGLYVMKEKNIDFDFYYTYFTELKYELRDSNSGKIITLQNYKSHIPAQGTIDIIALPL